MNIEEKLEIHDCPLCDGGALLEEEGGCGYYVMCLECGCQSVTIDFHSEEERLEAAKKTVDLWNAGKVISCNPGERKRHKPYQKNLDSLDTGYQDFFILILFPEGKLYLYLWQFQFLSIPKLKYLIFPSIWC